MNICYVNRTFQRSSWGIIDEAQSIIADYAQQGFILTLRQLYYQFVAANLIDNRQSEYKRLGTIIADARLAGLIDWDSIEDRGRKCHEPSVWSSPAELIEVCAEQYKIDLWQGQDWRPEVWVEKEALLSVVETACKDFRVPYFACKGYVSQSAMWEAGAVRLSKYSDAGQRPVILHLGDHDPSGIDMTRDIEDRLTLFHESSVRVERIALNYSQIEEFNPPPNPAKQTDSRFKEYASLHGDESWELDALTPQVLVELIQSEIRKYLVPSQWDVMVVREEAERADLEKVAREL